MPVVLTLRKFVHPVVKYTNREVILQERNSLDFCIINCLCGSLPMALNNYQAGGGVVMGKGKRKKRIKIRVTEEELNRLRDIAAELNSTLSDVLRKSTFSDKHDNRISIRQDDLQDFIAIINDVHRSLTDFCNGQSDNREDYLWELTEILKEIDQEYVHLRRLVIEKREKVSQSLSFYLAKEEAEARYTYYDKWGEKRKGICVSMTDAEIEEAKVLSDEHDCSVSCLLKTNALEKNKTGKITVDSASLDGVNRLVRRELRFLTAVISAATNGNGRTEDYENASKIAGHILSLIRQESDGITLDASDVRREAKDILYGRGVL